MCDLQQALCLAAEFACDIHPARVAIPAVHDHRDINVQDITILQHLVARNTVTNHVVYADTAGMLIALIPNSGRGGARGVHLIGDDLVQTRG